MKTFSTLTIFALATTSAMAIESATLLHTDCTQANFCVVTKAENQISVNVKNIADGQTISLKVNPTSQKFTKFAVDGLQPNTQYEYELSAKNKVKGKFKTSPDFKGRTPPPDFSFVVLGKNYVNDAKFDPPFRTNGGEFEIFEQAFKVSPNFAIWANGADTLRNADVGSESAMLSRFAKSRELKQAQNLLQNVPNYGVMSAEASSVALPEKHSATAKNAQNAFEKIWTLPQKNAGNYYSFSYSDADFFVLDTCTARSNLDYNQFVPEILGKEQLNWLMANLAASKANFKFVVLNIPLTNPAKNDKNFTYAPKERKALMDFLTFKKIEGVIVVSANKDCAEVTRFIRAGAYPLVEITAGAFTNRPASDTNEMNYFRMPNSLTKVRSFVSIKVDGTETDRQATISIINSKGDTLFSTIVKQSELKGTN